MGHRNWTKAVSPVPSGAALHHPNGSCRFDMASSYSRANAAAGSWLTFIEQFDYEIEHRPGTKHGNADGLS